MRFIRQLRNSVHIRELIVLLLCAGLVLPSSSYAGGPLFIGGPSFGTEGQPFTWDTTSAVSYRVDGGPLSVSPLGIPVVDSATGIARVQKAYQVWEDVPTANIRFTNAGPIQAVPPDFTGGDVSTPTQFNAVIGDCAAGNQSPIIFDADGFIFNQLFGDAGIIGFSGACKLDGQTGRIITAQAAFNGRFQDGVDTPHSSPANYEMTTAEFDEVLAHEFGHFLGLEHSQINVNILTGTPNTCPIDDLAGLPLMFPFAFCQARSSVSLPMLAPDDAAWVSRLYPETASAPPKQVPYSSSYGTITGTIYFSDGITQVQDVNVIARQISDGNAANGFEPKRVAFSSVSGYRFTGHVGQTVTPRAQPSKMGARRANLIGFYEIPVLPGTYTVEVESISPYFVGGSGVGPLSFPIPNPGLNEYWNSGESATDDPKVSTNITVAAGATVSNIDIILNGTAPRSDAFESAELQLPELQPRWLRRASSARELPKA